MRKKVEQFRKLPVFSLQELSKADWIIAFVMLAFLFVTFVGADIRLTGNRSFLYYQNFFQDFYKASYEQSNGFYANYLPSTFLVFAIWNLPLYLLGRAPAEILTNSLLNVMWYKLLPVLLYFAAGYLVYRIAMEIGFEEKKARLCQFSFIVCPIGVYSQFILSQYDIFMVFFMLLGLYFYYRGGMVRFALFFGIAATFKYQALAYFAVLLVLKEKRFRKLILYVLICIAPLAVMILPYINSPYFYRCVIGFQALNFADYTFEFGYIYGISLILAVGAYLLFWAYTRVISGREEFISWSLYLSCGVSFAVFGFSRWNPQWFLVMVPFLMLTLFLNRHGKKHMLLVMIFTLALYVFTVDWFSGTLDQVILKFGVFKFFLEDTSFAVTMTDVYGISAPMFCATCIFIILLLFFVFNHPKYLSLRHTEVQPYMINYIRMAFLIGFFAFVIPAGVCFVSAVQGNVIFADNTDIDADDCYTVDITDTAIIRQTFKADGDLLTGISIRVGMHNRINDSEIHVRIYEKESEETVYEGSVSTLHMVKEESMYRIVDENLEVTDGTEYVLELTGADDGNNSVATYYYNVNQGDQETVEIDGEETDCQLIMKIKGCVTE